jgi:hypothetical protein
MATSRTYKARGGKSAIYEYDDERECYQFVDLTSDADHMDFMEAP